MSGDEMTSWADMLKEACKRDGEDFLALICTLTREQMAMKFDAGYGGTNGAPFTAWGKEWVYFPICYDGAEWVGQAPRFPDKKWSGAFHQGG